MFSDSDVSSAADMAAFALEEHGLNPDQVQELSERIEAAITDYFASLWGRSDD